MFGRKKKPTRPAFDVEAQEALSERQFAEWERTGDERYLEAGRGNAIHAYMVRNDLSSISELPKGVAEKYDAQGYLESLRRRYRG